MPPRFMPVLLTVAEICRELNRSKGTISVWVQDGVLAPVDYDGPRGSARYDSVDVLVAAQGKGVDIRVALDRLPPAQRAAWDARFESESGAVDMQAEKALLTKAQRELAELRLAERRGQLLDAARTRQAIGSAMVAVRERVMAIETRAHGEMDADAHAWLALELRAALGEAADSAERIMIERLGEPVDDADEAA